jgi:hypothetical protein
MTDYSEEEQYWKRENGEVIAVGDMNEHHAKNVLRKMLKKSRQRGLDALEMRDKMRLISGMLEDIRSELL